MARRLDAALELLDRQLIGSDGRLAGKVDDLELTDPGGNLEPPWVTAVLTGPEALAGRLHSRLGRRLRAVAARLRDRGRHGASRIPFQQVEEVGSAIRLRLPADRLEGGSDRGWAGQLIGRLPGAGDAPE
jgi:sporulation protein YlmC with PRC-barrel domain